MCCSVMRLQGRDVEPDYRAGLLAWRPCPPEVHWLLSCQLAAMRIDACSELDNVADCDASPAPLANPTCPASLHPLPPGPYIA